MPYLLYTLLLFAFINCSIAYGQERKSPDRLKEHVKNIELYNRTFPREQVYLHFDNTGYFVGETIRFKAYVMRTDKGQATDLSRVLYVELLNPGGEVIESRKLVIEEGQADGDIKLDKVLVSGFYEVRAFTRYMTNWGKDECFSRVFPLFRKPKKEGDYSRMTIDRQSYMRRTPNYRTADTDDEADESEASKKIRGTATKVNFYPEGGRLVNGHESIVAFQLTDRDGRKFDTEGCIVDEEGVLIVDSVNTWMDGRGMFRVKPDGRDMYYIFTDRDGKKRSCLLPKALEEGCTMSVDTYGEEKIVASAKFSGSAIGKSYGMTWMHRGKVLAYKSFRADAENLNMEFTREKYPEGVSTITLFDEEGRICAERLVLIIPDPQREDSIFITPENTALMPCGKVTFNVQTLPNTTFSFSAMDMMSMPTGHHHNVKTWLLLTSELKGYIDNPGYYLAKDDFPHRVAADLLMLVQGWRKYDWRIMSGNKQGMDGDEKSSIPLMADAGKGMQPIEDRMYLDGKIYDMMTGKPATEGINLKATLYNINGEVIEGETRTNKDGSYVFMMPDMNGEWTMIMNITDERKKKKRYIAGIDRNFSPVSRVFEPEETDMKPKNNPFFMADSKKEEVYISTAKSHYLLPSVKVMAKRVYDRAREAWESERIAENNAVVFYNCLKENDIIAEKGMVPPNTVEWLMERNNMFHNFTDVLSRVSGLSGMEIINTNNTNMRWRGDYIEEAEILSDVEIRENGRYDGTKYESTDEKEEKLKQRKESIKMVEAEAANIDCRVFIEGPKYKNRPIIWVVNNDYNCTTGFSGRYCEVEEMPQGLNGTFIFPMLFEDVKSIYISEDQDIIRNYIQSQMLDNQRPVIVFIYRHYDIKNKDKGVRRTYFQGYNVPSTFEMEDYTDLPPMEDFRRTIFWEPNVKTDKDGKAKIEFFNNSSCTQMYISAEGMTKEGRFIVNE